MNYKNNNEDRAWIDWIAQYSELYDNLNYATSLQSIVMGKGHKAIESAFDNTVKYESVLEIGAGTGEHIPYVRHEYDKYILSDCNEIALSVAKKKLSNHTKGILYFEKQVGSQLSYKDNIFDRVIACHVLEHIYHPHIAIKEWCRVLKDNGVLSVIIPTDPGLAWRLGRRFGPRKKAIKKGIFYDYVMAREHVNSCINLQAILRYYFPDAREQWWPFSIPSTDLNLFYILHATIKK